MCLEQLKSLVRVKTRVTIVQTYYQANRDPALGHVVNESTAELFVSKRPPHCVNHAPAGLLLFRDVPDFLYPDRIHLRIPTTIKVELLNELFGQRSAGSFRKNGQLRAYIDS